MVRILMIGDVVGRPGRRAVQLLLPQLRQEYQIDLVVANAENTAGGFGLTVDTAHELLTSGVDVLTSGNHIWDQKEIIPYMDGELPLVRPLNYPPDVPGVGHLNLANVTVVNLMGRVFLSTVDCPFRTMNAFLQKRSGGDSPAIIVDMHAEATSEKQALGWYLDGRVSAVVGTHTHVGTVDARILPKGTAYVTDLGMVGPLNSVIGSDIEAVLQRFLSQTPRRFNVADGPVLFNSVMVEIDAQTGRAIGIQRIDRQVE